MIYTAFMAVGAIFAALLVVKIGAGLIAGPPKPKSRVDYRKIERLEIELGIVEAPKRPSYTDVLRDAYTGQPGEAIPYERGHRHPGYMRPPATVTRAMTDEDWRIAAKRYARRAHRKEFG